MGTILLVSLHVMTENNEIHEFENENEVLVELDDELGLLCHRGNIMNGARM